MIRPPGSLTALVVTSHPAVRSDWARYFEALGMRALRCVGPQPLCVLLETLHCRLHEEADLAVYDRASVTPELTLMLARASRALPIAFATDRLDEAGSHEPVITALASEGPDAFVGAAPEG